MYKRYSVFGNAAVGTNKTGIIITGGTTARPAVNEFTLGSDATPADVATRFCLKRATTAGTSTAFTPVPTDPGDVAAVTVGGIAASAEPTYTSNQEMWASSLNQRATFRWVAAPMGEIICPATASNGLGLKSVSSGGTPTYDYHLYFFE